jgi:membrane-associated phospholipid phosphatase
MAYDKASKFESVQAAVLRLNRYLVGVCAVAAMAVLDLFCLSHTGHFVRLVDLLSPVKGATVLACVAAGFEATTYFGRYQVATKKLRFHEIARTTGWMLLLGCYMLSGSVLSYLCATTGAHLVEDRLLRFDAALGFNWLAVYHWVCSHSAVHRLLQIAYDSGTWQLFFIPTVMGLFGRRKDISDFVLLFMLSGLLVMAISALFPAESAFVHFGILDPDTASTVSDFRLLRDGTLRTFDLRHMQGIVSMPSFHTALAIIFMYTVRRAPLLFAIAVPLNLAMIISTPTQGGHYLVDVVAGLITSALSILILEFLTEHYSGSDVVPVVCLNAPEGVANQSRIFQR